MRLKSARRNAAVVASALFAHAAATSLGAQAAPDIPAWLRAHVGYGVGQIAPVVLQRARALYFEKRRAGVVSNPCYFAMDATRPNDKGRRFYTICEASRSFRAVASGHGGGHNLRGLANFTNGRLCARNFGNAEGSGLTTGGDYVTAETKDSFKGYYRAAAGREAVLVRPFVQFEGEGDTANARERAIGGHAAELLRSLCRRKDPRSPYADNEGYVLFGKRVDYAGGRSNGCTSWSPSDAAQIVPLMRKAPTTLYIYPESRDIRAVAQAVKAGKSPAKAGLYWNAACLKQIHAPQFWSKKTLEPVIAQWRRAHPVPPPQPIPLCRGQ